MLMKKETGKKILKGLETISNELSNVAMSVIKEPDINKLKERAKNIDIIATDIKYSLNKESKSSLTDRLDVVTEAIQELDQNDNEKQRKQVRNLCSLAGIHASEIEKIVTAKLNKLDKKINI